MLLLIALAIAGLAIAALLTRAGLAVYAVGLVRAKNSAGTVVRTLSDLCVSVLAFWAVGWAILAQSHNKWFWLNPDLFFGSKQSVTEAPELFFYAVMILTATLTVSGAVAERCRLLPLCLSSLVMAGFVLPVTCNWAWGGWLKAHGYVDIAGGTSLHVAAGVFAIVALAMIGPRVGKFNRDGSSSMIPGHNLPLAAVGVLITLIGWIPYVAGANILRTNGSSDVAAMKAFIAGAAAVNVLLSASAAGAMSLLFGRLRYGKTDILLALTGMLGGMVAVCAGAAALPPWSALVIGAVAGLIVPLSVVAIDLRLRLDDPLGVIAIHVVGGAWGTLAAGVFILPIPPLNRLQQIGMQLLGIVSIAIFSAIVAVVFFGLLKMTIGLRAKEADEFDGLDLAEHDVGAYPDFQQNSIKSYHLREA